MARTDRTHTSNDIWADSLAKDSFRFFDQNWYSSIFRFLSKRQPWVLFSYRYIYSLHIYPNECQFALLTYCNFRFSEILVRFGLLHFTASRRWYFTREIFQL